MKTKFFSALLGAALCLFFAASSNAAPVVTIFAGSTGAFQSFVVASTVSTVCGPATNFWSQGSTAGNGFQDANGSPLEKGTLAIDWDGAADGSTAAHICVYGSVDSIVGTRLFFSTGPGGTRSVLKLGGTFANGNKVPLVPDTVITLPAAIIADLNNQPITAGVSDIRPEDAQFATARAKTSLGWGTNPVCSAFTSTSSQVISFTISGNDPISGVVVPAYSVINVGAYPMVLFYNNSAVTNPGDLGNLKPTDINSHNIAAIWGGLAGQTTDLGHFGAASYSIGGGLGTVPAGQPLTVLVREPTSGTYNTFNFQGVHNSGTALDQETIFPAPVANACAGPFPPTSPSGNPSYVKTAKGTLYARGIGTGEVVTQVKGTPNAIGYAFWTFSTFASTPTLSYLTVDGVDPIETAPTGGSLPQCTGAPLVCPVLPLTNVVNGSYRIWNIIRVVTSPAEAAAGGNVSTFVTQAQNQTVAPTAHPVTDFVPFVANGEQYLSVFRSHYSGPNLAALGVTPVCTSTTNINTQVNGPVPPGAIGCPEGGGDMAGAVFTWGADIDAYLLSGSELINFIQ